MSVLSVGGGTHVILKEYHLEYPLFPPNIYLKSDRENYTSPNHPNLSLSLSLED